ncbi:MAG: hypothetical protein ACOC9O_03625 [Myxococcota bacterium]
MSERGATREGLDPSRAMAALLGAPTLAWLIGTVLVTVPGVGSDWAFALGGHLVLPLWIGLACVLPLAPSGRVAWTICLAAGALLSATLWLGGGA